MYHVFNKSFNLQQGKSCKKRRKKPGPSAKLEIKFSACAARVCLGFPRPFVSDTSPKWIDREGLEKSRTGTRQGLWLSSVSCMFGGKFSPVFPTNGKRSSRWILFVEKLPCSIWQKVLTGFPKIETAISLNFRRKKILQRCVVSSWGSPAV